MIRPIDKDIIILSQKSVPATKADMPVLDDLLDTLRANADRCVGMAALFCPCFCLFITSKPQHLVV